MEKEIIDFRLTPIEKKLKEIIFTRPDIMDHILSAEELKEYLSWLVLSYQKDAVYDLKDLNMVPCSNTMYNVASGLLSNPNNKSALDALLHIYGDQNENSFFYPGIDISVSRQIRYIPAHWHSNDYFEIYYNMGDSLIKVYFPEETVVLKKGGVMIVTASAVHACPCLCDDDKLLFYMIRKSTFENVFWNNIPKDSLMGSFFHQILNGNNPTSYLHFETDDDNKIKKILTDIYVESEKENTYKGQMLNALMSCFFILLLRRYEDSVKLPRTKDFYWSKNFSAILSYLQTNYNNVSLKVLSEKFHYSEKQISRIVYKCMGISYNQLILRMKMEKAEQLLSNDTMTAEEISSQTGYSNTSSFYRAFTDYHQCTPKEYKEKMKGNK